MHGKVLNSVTKKPVAGAWIDVWQASTNGLYEQQDKDQVEHNLRGKFKTDENGQYGFYCLGPTPYPIPFDGNGHTYGLYNLRGRLIIYLVLLGSCCNF